MLQRISGAPCHLQVGLTPVILEGFIFQVASSARSGARTLGPGISHSCQHREVVSVSAGGC